LLVAVVVLTVCLVVGGVYVYGLNAAKPEFHVFNLQVINSDTFPVGPELITFDIQNLGTVPATDVKVDFVFTVNDSLVEGGQFEYTYTYNRDVLASKEVRDGSVVCGLYALVDKHLLNGDINTAIPEDVIQRVDTFYEVYAQLIESAPHNAQMLTQIEKEAIIWASADYKAHIQPSHYVITCAEGIIETFPF